MPVYARLSDFEREAARRLPRFLAEYIDGGAGSESTMARNIADLAAIGLKQRVLRNVADINLETQLFDETLALPVVLSPVGLGGLAARRGEVQAGRAAHRAGANLCVSTLAACSLPELTTALERPFWFQLYILRDRAFVDRLVDALEAARCPVLVLTVDLPMPGARARDRHSGLYATPGLQRSLRLALQVAARPRWALDVGLRGRPLIPGNVAPLMQPGASVDGYMDWIVRNNDPRITWDDLARLRQRWKGPLLVKGILDVEDARRAVALGADGLIISNHGGRQLDGAMSTARALPLIAAALDGSTPLLVDGGVRSGADVFRLLALGASAVMLGRPWVHALAANGEAGVAAMLAILAHELRTTMALTGCTRISAIGPDALIPAASTPPPPR
jgi:L-lactate dehydrogenase (cytochrome)